MGQCRLKESGPVPAGVAVNGKPNLIGQEAMGQWGTMGVKSLHGSLGIRGVNDSRAG